MKAYYAHPLSLYNTAQEKRDLALMAALGIEVFNPNSFECDAGYKAAAAASPTGNGMGFFTGIIKGCDMVIFRGFLDRSIPAGVAKEIRDAQGQGKAVLEFPTAIARRISTIVNPLAGELGFRVERIGAVNVEVFDTRASGVIPDDLAKEIRSRQAAETPFLEIPVDIAGRTLSVDATREALKETGNR